MDQSKSILLVKDPFLEEAYRVFDGTGVQVVTGSIRYLVSLLGEPAFRSQYATAKIHECLHRLLGVSPMLPILL